MLASDWLKNIIGFLLGSLVGVHLGMPLQLAPSEVLHWWFVLIPVPFSFGFLTGSLLGVSFGLPPWLAPSEVLLGGLIFWIYRLGSFMLPCVHALILLEGFQVLDSVVNILDLVRNDKLHPWKTSVTYEMLWEKNLLCLIFALLLSWGCIINDTCSVPFLVLCLSLYSHLWRIWFQTHTFRPTWHKISYA